ncbi:MAG: type II toxin-antitoxin system RelB/DinJ family antitoxin [Lachnospiraceae bacterium]|nr:type II toxin-antitoxin system RelB/DinJ family antitoxin [Lachnospiraceae bacterium]
MTTISIRLDDDEKKELEEMCSSMGMSISTFYMLYTKKALRDRRIPFEITAPKDPFYSSSNISQLKKADRQIRNGQVVEKTMEELEALESE